MVTKISSKAEFDDLITSGEKFVVDFYADWCGPCKKIAPEMEKLAAKHTNVKFVKIDVDDDDEGIEAVTKKYSVTSMPTFLLFSKGKLVEKTIGANVEKVTEMIEKLASS